MKNTCLLLIFTFLYLGAHAQSKITGGTVLENSKDSIPAGLKFENKQFYIQNDSLYVLLDLVVQDNAVPPAEALHIMPVYKSGSSELPLPEILINGSRRSRYYRREQALLAPDAYLLQRPYIVHKLSKEEGPQLLSYHIALPLAKQQGGRLIISFVEEDCCDLRLLATVGHDVVLSPPALPGIHQKNVVFLPPKREENKVRNKHFAVRINYIVDRYDILPEFANNARELQRIDSLLAPFADRTTYQITSSSIKGYASPEAPYDYNLKLSERRAEGFKRYLLENYGDYGFSSIKAEGLGEDWAGLRLAVENGNMENREQVLYIIDNVDLFKGREKQLMDLNRGATYRYMLKEYYPPLRRMEMEIAYTVRHFEKKEAEIIIEGRPQDLSHEEFFKVANLRNNAHTPKENYGREYDLAVKYFPEDTVAYINASSAALIREDLPLAWSYLSKLQDVPEAYNNLGVYCYLSGDKEQAGYYFRKALNVAGCASVAEYNLKELMQ